MEYQGNKFRENYTYLADDNVFDVFSFKMKAGHARTGLSQPNNVFLSEDAVTRLFGADDPIGKEISVIYDNSKVPLRVAGVFENIPQNSHILIDYMISYSTYPQFHDNDWYVDNWYASHTYILLDPKANTASVEASITKLVDNYIKLDLFESYRLVLQPITDIYFNFMSDGGSQRGSDIATNMFLILGFFILFIASLNFINLSTARSIRRAHEVGLRKVLGARRKQLVGQFLGESMLISAMAAVISVFIMKLLIPLLNSYSNIMYTVNLDIDFIDNWQFLIIIIATFLAVGFLSGLYPAFALSGFSPISAFKQARGSSALGFRKVLVVFQYSFSVVLIFLSLGLYKLFSNLKTQDMGFEKEHLVALTIDQEASLERLTELKIAISKLEGVQSVASSSKIPTSLRNDNSINMIDPETNILSSTSIVFIDKDYVETIGLELLKKQVDLYQDIENRKDICLANEAFIRKFGDQYSVGDNIIYKANKNYAVDEKEDTYQIAGIVNDFRHRDIAFLIGAALFVVDDQQSNYLMVRLNPGDHGETLTSIHGIYQEIIPDQFFEYTFIDDEMAVFIGIFSPFADLMFYATVFAIMIASMGLFALALFTTQQRVKEIGIRKVFGSSEMRLSSLLSGQFVKLVLIGFVISGPITYWGMRFLLSQVPQKVEFDFFLFISVGVGIFLVSLLTVAGQSWRVASFHPAETLHNE